MANIKFSDFTVGNTEGDIDFVVGYKGASNIQISPTNLLASALGNYLPLAGGTMTGNLKLNDNVEARFGTSGDSRIFHDAVNTYIDNFTGHLKIRNYADDGDIIFQSDDGSGGLATYFFLDGGDSSANPLTVFPDNARAGFGASGDLQIYHNGTDNYIENTNNDLYIKQTADDKDIVFQSDNGAGGVTDYLRLDGSVTRIVSSQHIQMADGKALYVGESLDAGFYHSTVGGGNNFIENNIGNLNIVQNTDDGDIIFSNDDGSGGVTPYLTLDGGDTRIKIPDNIITTFGNGGDLQLSHDATDSLIRNYTGDLKITNFAADKEITFFAEAGGSIVEYLSIGGSNEFTKVSKDFRFIDSTRARFGTSDDLQIYHDGTNSVINNTNGNLQIYNNADDKDIVFLADDGSGGTAEYFLLDGSIASGGNLFTRFPDNSRAVFGTASDLQIYHNSTSGNGIIENNTGNLVIQNNSDDSDVIFRSDDGSGSVTEYFKLDGANGRINFSVDAQFSDSKKARFGDSADLQLYHTGTASNIYNITGDLNISNDATDGDISFISDDGSGGTTEYFRIDGGATKMVASKDLHFSDNVKAMFGNISGTSDLKIYHDGNNSIISDTGTGHLLLTTTTFRLRNDAQTEEIITADENGAVKLYYDGSKKFETTSAGVKITSVSEYADNTAAIAGGLTTGEVYRTGDLLKIVH